MRLNTTGSTPISRRMWVPFVGSAVTLLGVLSGPDLVRAYIGWRWFETVGYRGVFTTIAVTRLVLFVAAATVAAGMVWLAMESAFRARPIAAGHIGHRRTWWRATLTEFSRLLSVATALPTAVVAGWVTQRHWALFQASWHSTPFDTTDPVFGLDDSFYAFVLPCYRFVLVLTLTLLGLSILLALGIHCLCGGIRFKPEAARKWALRIGVDSYRHLVCMGAIFLLLKSINFWLDRYSLLLAHHGSTFDGATYSDMNTLLPAKTVLSLATLSSAGLLIVAMLRSVRWLPSISISMLILSAIILEVVWPAAFHQFYGLPTRSERESAPIVHNIAATLDAFDLTAHTVTYSDYHGQPSTGLREPDKNLGPTLANLPMLDPSRLSDTFTQLQQHKQFYGFSPNLTVDRYRIRGRSREYLVAARQLNPAALTGTRANWINKHLIYTHGNGLVAAPMNEISTGSGHGGYPRFVDIADGAANPLTVDQPRIYYSPLMGEDYSIVGATLGGAPCEYDTPTSNVTYTGRGGVELGGFANRVIMALYLGDLNILLSDSVTAHSKVLLVRDPRERVHKIAPWLTIDRAPYPAVVDGRIVWIVDGYTTLVNYPYAAHVPLRYSTSDSRFGLPTLSATSISYLRNSVKATVDAYSGTVILYATDQRDPVLRTWEKVFPNTVRPAATLKNDLRAHLRYPQDLFEVQRALLTRYHVTNPQKFLAGADFWHVPRDPTVDTISPRPPRQTPSYQLAALPGRSVPRFQLTSPVTSQDQRQVSGYLSASYDSSGYGHINVVHIPPDANEPDPLRKQHQFLTQPNVAHELTSLESAHNKIDYGNLLLTPTPGGLLYTEPIYIQEATDTSYPFLFKIMASFKGRNAYAADLNTAVNQILDRNTGGEYTVSRQPVAQPYRAPATVARH